MKGNLFFTQPKLGFNTKHLLQAVTVAVDMVFERKISSLTLQMCRALSGGMGDLISAGDEKPLLKAAKQPAFMGKQRSGLRMPALL